jgi:uncharacterized membrane protein (UPF0127 family)
MTKKGLVTFDVEVVRTPKAREVGLMNRTSMDEKRGMLFIFDEDSDHAFWMRNTLLPLDIVFFDKNFYVVGVLENMQPMSERSRSIGVQSRYALEINAGLVAKLKIASGAQAAFVESKGK